MTNATNLSTFNFNSKNPIRIISNDNDSPLFVATDVARALGYKRPNDALTQFCKGAVKHRTLSTSGGKQKLRVICEPDVYRLIFGSKLKSAQKFQNWVFEEVLPSIRKTGKYDGKLSPAHQRALQNAVAVKVDHNRALSAKVWGAIKDKFKVPRYSELPDSSFDLVLTFVQNFKLTALPAPEINEDERSLAAFRRGRSAGIRRHAEQAAEWLRRVGQGHNDRRATYSGSRMINLEDIKNIRNAREELFKMENLLLNFNIENDPFQSKEQIIRSVMNG